MPKFILIPLSGLLLLTGQFLLSQAFAQTHQTVAAGSVGTSNAPATTNAVVTVIVDAVADRHPISPNIYGVGAGFASSNQLSDLNVSLNRFGGNAETRYNWRLNAHNRGGDWYFESVNDGNAMPGASADDFVANSKNGGAQAMITVPMIGWMPKLGPGRGRLASYSIAKYGPQTGRDSQSFPDAGNGIGTNSTTHAYWLITTNDPGDANFLANCAFQQTYVQHLINRWGLSTNGGVRYYLMDNEHSIWHETHRDVHPTGTTMQEIRDKMFEYAGMVKSNDPNALVLGPEEWGWSGYFNSGYDQQNPGQRDRVANGGWDYLPWLLDQFHRRATHTNQRLLDYFTVHYYPQNGEFGTNVSVAMQLTRNRSTRVLWDTNYTDESWINSKVMLIPRLKKWVAQYYPGTAVGITEYDWGAEHHINGATAQADVLGIFGKENVDLATRWTVPETNTPVFNAFKMYRNYDGKKSAFGDTSISTAAPDPDTLSAFAAIRARDGALTVMVINKALAGLTPLSLEINHFAGTNTAQAWQLTSNNTIARLGNVPFRNRLLKSLLPAQSITLFIVPAVKKPSSDF